jgi:hypothetical protein
MTRTAIAIASTLLLVFTGFGSARAQEARSGPSGLTVRGGSAVGFSEFGGTQLSLLGVRLGVAQRLGPVSLEAGYDVLSMSDAGPIENTTRGTFQRWGVTARLRVINHQIGRASFLRLWVEGGAGRQRARWYRGEVANRADGLFGFGVTIDHDLTGPHRGLPRTVGWNFGWRFMTADGDSGQVIAAASCRRSRCTPEPPPPYDLAVLLGSELIMSW